ncbi:hypothetical protein ACIBEJ_10285 [Nonomuraea sp. NPDC050790]|uniref:hypothetical protein n=1 Tax=Nonomuraea sp. NPDC050790 TaxID=3364371 RepID=UPI0037880427
MTGTRAAVSSPARLSARRLVHALDVHGLPATVHEGYGIALVSIQLRLLIWVECGSYGWHFRWWTGEVSRRTGHWIWALCPAAAASTAARRIVQRYEAVLGGRPSQYQ